MNILHFGLKEAREKSINLQRVRELSFSEVEKCKKCSLFKLCFAGGCRAYAVMRTGSLYGYVGDAVCRARRRRVISGIIDRVNPMIGGK